MRQMDNVTPFPDTISLLACGHCSCTEFYISVDGVTTIHCDACNSPLGTALIFPEEE